MTLRVLAFVPHPRAGASERYRVYGMADALQGHGIELDVRAFRDARAFARLYQPGRVVEKALDLARGMRRRLRDLEAAEDFALVLVHRELWPLAGYRAERRLAGRHLPWVYDLDDAVFLPNVSVANRRFVGLKPFAQPARLVAGARAVAAGNDWLADWARRLRPGRPADEVAVVPTAVDTARWAPRPRAPGPLRLVWIGSHSTVGYLRPLVPVLQRLARRHVDLEVHHVGAALDMPGVRLVRHPWSEDTEVEWVAGADVGLAPLPDNDWSRGKCGLKLLLYMACGLPAVASPVGVHTEIVRHGEDGLLAPDAPAFGEALEALLGDAALRARLGAAARATVQARYSVSAVAPRLAALLRRAAGAPAEARA